MAKIIILIMILFLIMPTILSNDLEISLKPHFFKDGREVLPTPEIQYSAISFEIIGENFNQKYRLLNLSIVDSFPQEFKKALPLNIVEMLRIKQSKTLWISQIIDIKNLNQFNQTNISLWLGVEGIHEGTGEPIYQEGHLNLELQEPPISKQGSLILLGEYIWEDNPLAGNLIILVAIFGVGFSYWKFKGSDKINKWRENTERRRIARRRYEEGY